jgi:hypothetical protein
MGIAQRFHPVEATLFTGDARRPQVEKQFCPLPDFLFFGANLAQTLFDLIFWAAAEFRSCSALPASRWVAKASSVAKLIRPSAASSGSQSF